MNGMDVIYFRIYFSKLFWKVIFAPQGEKLESMLGRVQFPDYSHWHLAIHLVICGQIESY